jgi:3-oxoadipate enol-lactonase
MRSHCSQSFGDSAVTSPNRLWKVLAFMAAIFAISAVKIGTEQSWGQRIAAVQNDSIESLADTVMKMWFSKDFHQRAPEKLSLYRTMLARTYPAGYLACCEALRDADFTARAANKDIPTLFIAGDQDGSTPSALVQSSARLVPGSRFQVISGSAHILCVENPDTYVQLLKTFAK